MGEELNTGLGRVKISNEVIAQYAGNAAMECVGIVGIGAMSARDGFARLIRSDKLSHGVSVSEKDGKLSIDFHVIVAYQVSIQAVCQNLIDTVVYQVEGFTGLKIEKINIYVEGVRLID